MIGFVSVALGIVRPLGNVFESPNTPLLSNNTPPFVEGETNVTPGVRADDGSPNAGFSRTHDVPVDVSNAT